MRSVVVPGLAEFYKTLESPQPEATEQPFGTPTSGSTPLSKFYAGLSAGGETGISITSPQRDIGFGEHVVDFLADQLDPLNLVLLASGYGLSAKLAKLVPPVVKGAATLARTGAPAFVKPSMSRLFLHTAARELGWAFPFASAEFFEEPEPGQTRLGEFTRSLIAFEIFGLGLAGAGRGLRFVAGGTQGLARRDSQRALAATFDAAVRAAEPKVGRLRAADMALTDLLDRQVVELEDVLGPKAASEIVGAARRAAAMTGTEMFGAGLNGAYLELASNPALAGLLRDAKIDPRALMNIPVRLAEEATETRAAALVKEAEEAVSRTIESARLIAQAPDLLQRLQRRGAPVRFPGRLLESPEFQKLAPEEQQVVREWYSHQEVVRGERVGPFEVSSGGPQRTVSGRGVFEEPLGQPTEPEPAVVFKTVSGRGISEEPLAGSYETLIRKSLTGVSKPVAKKATVPTARFDPKTKTWIAVINGKRVIFRSLAAVTAAGLVASREGS